MALIGIMNTTGKLTLADLQSDSCDRVIFRGISGSRAYGTSHAASDTDIRGIFVTGKTAYLTLNEEQKQVSDERGDICYYSLRRFCELAAAANPNFLELLFLPEDCMLFHDHYFDWLSASRDIFISQLASKSYLDYAQAQIKKARGQNKRVHHPYSKEVPRQEDFCWFIPSQSSGVPGRPISIKESGHALANCHIAAVEHTEDLYRLYDYGKSGRGAFRNGMLVCESIPPEDEVTRFCGYLIYRAGLFERALTEHRQYWEWYEQRNAARWQTQETGAMDYDAKNLMHTFRLMYSGLNILTHGVPLVRFTGDKLQFLLDIKAGKFAYDELQQQAETLAGEFDEQRRKSTLPPAPDLVKINHLLREITEEWESHHAN